MLLSVAVSLEATSSCLNNGMVDMCIFYQGHGLLFGFHLYKWTLWAQIGCYSSATNLCNGRVHECACVTRVALEQVSRVKGEIKLN